MNDSILGVIVGGIIGIAGSMFSYFLERKDKKKNFIFNKKENTYLRAIDIMTRFYTEIPNSVLDDKVYIAENLKVELNSLKSIMTIYAEEEIYDYFLDTIAEIVESKMPNKTKDNKASEMMRNLNRMILQDLDNYIKI